MAAPKPTTTPETTDVPPTTEPTVTAPDLTAQLAALAAAGSFVERRVSRGQGTHDERLVSDEIMTRIADLLAQ